MYASVSMATLGVQPTSKYLLQVSSNLDCEQLEINLSSQNASKTHTLRYTQGAFAAVNLPKGSYTFSSLSCTSKQFGQEQFDDLLSSLAPISISVGQNYYGGKLILKQTLGIEQNLPDVLENCTNIISNARGESSNACTDGVGVSTDIEPQRVLSVYAPELAEEKVQVVRNALDMSSSELVYIPLEPIQN